MSRHNLAILGDGIGTDNDYLNFNSVELSALMRNILHFSLVDLGEDIDAVMLEGPARPEKDRKARVLDLMSGYSLAAKNS